MTLAAQTPLSEALLALLAAEGEMKAQDFLTHVQRTRGDLDFYPVAALLHAGYITTDSETNTAQGKTIEGKLGGNLQATAVFLCQLMLPPGESFQINNCPRDSAYSFPVKIFMTADGYLRLDELEQRRVERKRKRIDYIVSLTVAVLVALLSSYLAHYFATKRLQIERAQQPTTSSLPSPTR